MADAVTRSDRQTSLVLCGYHARGVSADARRDRKLACAGYRVVRLQAELVMRDLPAALLAVRRALIEP